jgi:predicted extracellular nuclease
MANLTVATFSGGESTQTLAAATAGGDTVQNYSGKEFLVVNNAHATLARTVTIDSVEACNQGSDHNLVVSIAALTTKRIHAPAPASRWKDVNGHLQITYSDSAADLSIQALKWPE